MYLVCFHCAVRVARDAWLLSGAEQSVLELEPELAVKAFCHMALTSFQPSDDDSALCWSSSFVIIISRTRTADININFNSKLSCRCCCCNCEA